MAVGVVDDSHPLGAGIKFILQIVAALIAIWHGVIIEAIASPFPFGDLLDGPQELHHGLAHCGFERAVALAVELPLDLVKAPAGGGGVDLHQVRHAGLLIRSVADGRVLLMDDPTVIMKQFKRAITDSDTERCVRYAPDEKPGVAGR